jgi:hypothetical protein
MDDNTTMDVHEFLYHINAITKQEAMNKSVSNSKAQLFKKIYEHISDKIKDDGNRLIIATAPSSLIRTEAEYNEIECSWTVYINLSDARMNKDCALWDLLHEYGHTKNAAMRKCVSLEEWMQHEEKAWEVGWKDVVAYYPSLIDHKSGFEKWRDNCLDDWRRNYKPVCKQ